MLAARHSAAARLLGFRAPDKPEVVSSRSRCGREQPCYHAGDPQLTQHGRGAAHLAAVVAAAGCSRAASQGRKPGTHITAEHLRKRLAVHGITSRPGRHGALLALAGRLPAPILAERLGIHQARAAQWARAAGATYSGYVELRA